MDFDSIVVGGGPAGLTAATLLAREGRRVLLLDRESFGGPIINVEWIDGYPAPGERIAGSKLSSQLVVEAEQAGVAMEIDAVIEIEPYSNCLSVTCESGKAFTTPTVVLAGGLTQKALGVPGEDAYQGKGMVHCAMCDAGLYRDKVVAVCGGGDSGAIESMYLARFASKVYLIEARDELNAAPALRERVGQDPKVEVRRDARPVEVRGDAQGVTALIVERAGQRESIEVFGVLVRNGFVPTTGFLEGVVDLDDTERIEVDEACATSLEGVFAIGDIRGGSPRGVAAAVEDGRRAAASVQHHLQQQSA